MIIKIADVVRSEKFFPSQLIIIDICAAVRYIPTADWRHFLYWIAAAVLTITVTY